MLPRYADPFFARLTLDIALRSRELHGVGVDGQCLYCAAGTPWPCEPFQNAHGAVQSLTTSPLPRRRPGEALAAIRRP